MYHRIGSKKVSEKQVMTRATSLLCCACLKFIAHKPVITKCGHIACKDCADLHMDGANNEAGTPCWLAQCVHRITTQDIFAISPRSEGPLREMWNEVFSQLPVKCSDETCGWKGTFGHYPLHLAVCPYQLGYENFPFKLKVPDPPSVDFDFTIENRSFQYRKAIQEFFKIAS